MSLLCSDPESRGCFQKHIKKSELCSECKRREKERLRKALMQPIVDAVDEARTREEDKKLEVEQTERLAEIARRHADKMSKFEDKLKTLPSLEEIYHSLQSSSPLPKTQTKPANKKRPADTVDPTA